MLNTRAVEVGTWVSIQDGCPIRYEVANSGAVEFRCGPGSTFFDLEFESEALREFIRLADQALADMDTRFAAERQDV